MDMCWKKQDFIFQKAINLLTYEPVNPGGHPAEKWGVCQISFHICHMFLGPKKLSIPKPLQKPYVTMKFMHRFPTATCCNNFGITTNYHSSSTNITITIITPSPSSHHHHHHHHQHLSFNHHHHHQGDILFAVLTATQVLTPF